MTSRRPHRGRDNNASRVACSHLPARSLSHTTDTSTDVRWYAPEGGLLDGLIRILDKSGRSALSLTLKIMLLSKGTFTSLDWT
jgi:hypothetical protein